MSQPHPAPLVWINGFPGTGKSTIASILAHKLMESQCTLVHNHDLIDSITCARDHPMYRTLRKEERSKAFARHVLATETLGTCVIFTDSQSDNEEDAAVALEYRDVAAQAGRLFVPVYLRLSKEENVLRLTSSSRAASGTGKFIDPSVLLSIRDTCDLFEFSDVEALSLDVTELAAEESARQIYQHLRQSYHEQF